MYITPNEPFVRKAIERTSVSLRHECPQDLLPVIEELFCFLKTLFRKESICLQEEGVSIAQFLQLSDFSIQKIESDIRDSFTIERYVYWFWILFLAEQIFSQEVYALLKRSLENPDTLVLLSTWTKRNDLP